VPRANRDPFAYMDKKPSQQAQQAPTTPPKIELPAWPHKWFPGEVKKEVKPNLTVVKTVTPINPNDVVQVVFRDLFRRDPTCEERLKWQDYLVKELTTRLRPFKR
jgi:hypothetical protein